MNCPTKSLQLVQSKPVLNKTSITGTHDIVVFDSIDAVPQDKWVKVDNDNGFCSAAYFRAFENSNLQDIKNFYVLFLKDQEVVGRALFQEIEFSGDQIRAYLDMKPGQSILNFIKKQIGDFAARKSGKVLVLGNLLVTADFGFCFDDSISSEERCKYILDATNQIDKKYGRFHLALYKDFPESMEQEGRSTFKGFSHFIADPNMVMDVDWDDYDGYLQALTSKYRVRAKKVHKVSTEMEIVELNADNFDLYKADIERLYNNVMDKIDFKMAVANADYFHEMSKQLGENMIVYVYVLDGKVMAFNTALLQKDLYEVHLIGLDYERNIELKLYNRILYDNLMRAIQLGFKKVGFGRTANEIKSTVGAIPNEMQCYMKLQNPILNLFTPTILSAFKPKPWQQRIPFKQK